jgi:hypothetical protein
MAILSALVAQCRRDFGDNPKSSQVARMGNGVTNLFNIGKYPIVENSYTIYINNVSKAEGTDYVFDLDNGDLRTLGSAVSTEVRSEFQYANWRDKNWIEAINKGIDDLNGKGFFKQVVNDRTSLRISANVQSYSAPSGSIDVYDFLVSDNNTISGNFKKPAVNWSYQQDANKLTLESKPSTANYAQISYLRNLRKYTASSATVDVTADWLEMVMQRAGAHFYRYMAGKIAKQGNATIDEGHFSFTNLRTMANDLNAEFENLAKRKKPTRPAKEMQYAIKNNR